MKRYISSMNDEVFFYEKTSSVFEQGSEVKKQFGIRIYKKGAIEAQPLSYYAEASISESEQLVDAFLVFAAQNCIQPCHCEDLLSEFLSDYSYTDL